MAKDWIIALPENAADAALDEGLSRSFARQPGDAVRWQRLYFDTFDWRLNRAGMALFHGDGRYVLSRRSDGKALAEAEAPAPVRFARDLPAGRLRDEIAPLLDVRALLLLVTVEGAGERTILQNGDLVPVLEASRVSVRAERRRSQGGSAPFLLVRPLPGNGSYRRRLLRDLRKHGIDTTPVDLLGWALDQVGLRADDERTGVRGLVSPGMTAGEGIRHLCVSLERTIRRNRGGIVADIDPEFLHDLRVAARRTRTLLKIGGGVVDAQGRRDFRQRFRALGADTGRLRDLDVLLAAAPQWEERLPAPARPGWPALRDGLAEMRRLELQRVVSTLQSSGYRVLMRDWRRFLAEPAAFRVGPRADRELAEFARRRIRKLAARVLDCDQRPGTAIPDAELHRLRIAGKNLRYALEFFGVLLPRRPVKRWVRRLKRLQDVLGDHHDACIQEDVLVEALHTRAAGHAAAGAAAGALFAELARTRQRLAARFADRYAEFAAPEAREDLQLLRPE